MGGGGGFPRSETPSSVFSSADSELRFTRRLGSGYRVSCCLALLLITILIAATLSLYVAYVYVSMERHQEKTYRGVMRIIEGDWYRGELADPSTELYQSTCASYREALNLWLRRSWLRSAFIAADILAFDGRENEDLIVHFQLRFRERRMVVESDDVMSVLSSDSSVYLGDRILDPRSLVIMEMDRLEEETATDRQPLPVELSPPSSSTDPAPRHCVPARLGYCQDYSNGTTSYPNLIGHSTVEEVINDVIAFRELVDSECYSKAQEFVCGLLQPVCSERLVLPCRELCAEFWAGCGSRLPLRLSALLDCNLFPEDGLPCSPKPPVCSELRCEEGTGDCPAPELPCPAAPRCPVPSQLPCPGSSSGSCIPREALCDGTPHCPDGSDERACLTLAPSLSSLSSERTAVMGGYFSGGDVIFTERGERGKVCVGTLNDSLTSVEERHQVLQTIGNSLCKNLSFRSALTVSVEKDNESDSKYVKMANPKAAEISFIPSHCDSKEILNVRCSQLECGLQPLRSQRGIDGLRKVSSPGDWPWHVALFKSGTHICDATLVALDWLLTTASCFQGQKKAEWTARGGGTGGTAGGRAWGWEVQERHILGMVKSRVEGSTVVLLRLTEPFQPTDFLRPICLPDSGSDLKQLEACNTLAWTRNRTVLQRVELKMSPMERCANISITTVNSICTDSVHENEDCSGEELAGSPMTCLDKEQRWVLAGLSNWRIACSRVGDRRPRLYDQILSNVDWVLSTLHNYTLST